MQKAIQLFADILATAESSGPSKATALVLQAAAVPPLTMENFAAAWAGAVSIAQGKKGVSIQSIAGVVSGSRARLIQLAATGRVMHDAQEQVKAITADIFLAGLSVLAKKVEDAAAEVKSGADPVSSLVAVTRVAERLRQGVTSQSYGITVTEVMDQGIASAEAVASAGVVTDIRSGIHSLDGAMGGGLRRGGLHVFGFRTSDGKTTLGVQQAIVNATSGKRVLLISLEMDAALMGERILVHETRRPWSTLVDGGKDQTISLYKQARDAWDEVKDKLIIVPDMQLDSAGIRMALLDAETRHGPVDLLIVDHAQIVLGGGDVRQARYQEVGGIALDLASLSKENHIAVILYSQLNPIAPEVLAQKKKLAKAGVDAYEPGWADLRESRDIGMHAHSIVLGWTSWDDHVPVASYFKVEKARQAKRGTKVQVTYKPWIFKFEDYVPQAAPGEEEDEFS